MGIEGDAHNYVAEKDTVIEDIDTGTGEETNVNAYSIRASCSCTKGVFV